ncbi:MAG: hypothetical protein ED559_00360 [Phycisphaera sp.]|nr:MAG: hypothetical protein ED559_00360 [Phycisphaera sp.]
MRISRSSAKTMSHLLPVAAASAALLVVPGCNLSSGSNKPVSGAGDTLMLLPEHAGGPTGTIRRTDLLVAYGKSVHLKEHYSTLETARDAAREAGDDAFADRIEAEGPAWQEVLDRQLAGDEPLYTTLLAVQNEIRDVANEHGISKVVEAGPGVKGTDITDKIVEALKQSDD